MYTSKEGTKVYSCGSVSEFTKNEMTLGENKHNVS
jgi:hypothetical protein